MKADFSWLVRPRRLARALRRRPRLGLRPPLAPPRQSLLHPPQGLENFLVQILQDVEDAQLVAGL